MNKVIVKGRLCFDPEFRQTTSGIPVCRIKVAVNRPKKQDGSQEADFISCTAWRSSAEFISRYFSKGQEILIEGQLRNNDYTDNNGVKHYSMDVLIERADFCGSKSDNAQNGQQAQYNNTQASAPARQQPSEPAQGTLDIGDLGEFEEILSDGEVPF